MTAPDWSPPVPLPVVPPPVPPQSVPPLPVPPGPGVQAPFPAPPTDGNRRRLGIGLAVGGVVLALCCVGGVLGARTLVTSSVQAARNQAVKVVTAYLTYWRDQEYDKAYDLLCDDVQQRETLAEFTADLVGQPALESFTVGAATIASNYVRVPAELSFRSENQSRVYSVVTNPDQTGSICG
jgi:hypothetical protein